MWNWIDRFFQKRIQIGVHIKCGDGAKFLKRINYAENERDQRRVLMGHAGDRNAGLPIDEKRTGF